MRSLLRKFIILLFLPLRLLAKLMERLLGPFVRIGNRANKFLNEEPEDTPLGDAFAKTVENPMGIMEHLNAMRIHLFRAVSVLVLATAFAFTFAQQILDFLAQPAGGIEALVAIDVTEPLSVLMKLSLLAGFTITLPYLVFEIYLFVAPGLSSKARKSGLLAIPIVVLFFLTGMAFGYFVMLPTGVPFLISIMGIQTQLRPSTYFSFVTNVMFWLGIAFEFPIVIFILASLGLVNPKQLTKQWRLALVVIAIVSAFITPTVDPVNMGLVMLPLMVLYVISIGLAAIAQNRIAKRGLLSPIKV